MPRGRPHLYIRNLAQLCDYFDAVAPRSLNRALYKGTDCGASISIQLANGEWLHNGDERWKALPRHEPIRAFTIQTIVEGSEATVDSAPFELPVKQGLVESWMREMEQEASRLWDEANRDEEDDEEA